MSDTPRTDSKTLAEAMGQIAILLQTDDGVANAAIAEAANRITELERELAEEREGRQAACRRTAEVLCELAEANAQLDQWDRDNIDDEIDRKENQND